MYEVSGTVAITVSEFDDMVVVEVVTVAEASSEAPSPALAEASSAEQSHASSVLSGRSQPKGNLGPQPQSCSTSTWA